MKDSDFNKLVARVKKVKTCIKGATERFKIVSTYNLCLEKTILKLETDYLLDEMKRIRTLEKNYAKPMLDNITKEVGVPIKFIICEGDCLVDKMYNYYVAQSWLHNDKVANNYFKELEPVEKKKIKNIVFFNYLYDEVQRYIRLGKIYQFFYCDLDLVDDKGNEIENGRNYTLLKNKKKIKLKKIRAFYLKNKEKITAISNLCGEMYSFYSKSPLHVDVYKGDDLDKNWILPYFIFLEDKTQLNTGMFDFESRRRSLVGVRNKLYKEDDSVLIYKVATVIKKYKSEINPTFDTILEGK